MAIFVNTGTLNIRESHRRADEPDAATPSRSRSMIVALLVFAGAMGKSAQFPLHVWLPDAMEGPTPVSALIHAATMVNAGVYLVARANPLFAAAPSAMVVVAGDRHLHRDPRRLDRDDPDRHQARPRLLDAVSQLGYMFAALGVGAFTAAIFHLMTHGFFKGLLFLGSGSVIHAVHEEQDMRQMGGLSKKIPITYATMLIGSLAIAGIPPLAGFFSKDEILGESFKQGFQWVWAIGFVVAVHDRVLHVPAHGPDVLGHVPRPEGGLGQDPRVAAGDDRPADPAGHPVGVPRHVPRACRSAPARSPAGSSRSSRSATRRSATRRRAFALFGIDGVLILASVTVAVVGIAIAWRLFGVELARPAARRATRARPRAQRPGPVPLPRVAQQVVVRRAQPPAVHRHRRPGRRRPVVVRPRGRRRHGQRRRPLHGRVGPRAPPRPDRPRPELRAGHRHRADRHGRLVPRCWWDAEMDLTDVPILIDRHVPAARSARSRSRSCRRASPARVALGFALVTWVASLAPARRPTCPAQRRASSSASSVDWIPVFGIQYKLGADGLSVALVVLTTTLTLDQHPRELQADPDADQGIHGLASSSSRSG